MNSRKQDDETVMSSESKNVLKGIAELLPRSFLAMLLDLFFVDDHNGQIILTGQLIFVIKISLHKTYNSSFKKIMHSHVRTHTHTQNVLSRLFSAQPPPFSERHKMFVACACVFLCVSVKTRQRQEGRSTLTCHLNAQ